ncbi:hypothetical protein PLESTB_000444200 [Pleodorina starrii]|uniref:phytol kinase n=1 Tax=Pleodorina starrii TaxID=330485 RepID=A0A9W6F085_9CHLO|nr:hypothetical protein PLESTM_000676600 [Pleodorina starrii]GLC50896.1 hypothetical protein PLESTB_000444200 [Pleodorina starrii]GLC73911.1 hypothetical protein PLESTF_001436500 [Pleodorina starrii]
MTARRQRRLPQRCEVNRASGCGRVAAVRIITDDDKMLKALSQLQSCLDRLGAAALHGSGSSRPLEPLPGHLQPPNSAERPSTTTLSTGDETEEWIQLQLKSARRAAELEMDAMKAASCLASVTDALVTVQAISPPLRAAAAAETRSLVVQLAESLAQLQRQQVLAAADASRAALAAGDLDGAAATAIRAHRAADVMLWAAYISGLRTLQEVDPAQRAASEALAALAAAASSDAAGMGKAVPVAARLAAASLPSPVNDACSRETFIATVPASPSAQPTQCPGPTSGTEAGTASNPAALGEGSSIETRPGTAAVCTSPRPFAWAATAPAPERTSAAQPFASAASAPAPQPTSTLPQPASASTAPAPEPTSAAVQPSAAAPALQAAAIHGQGMSEHIRDAVTTPTAARGTSSPASAAASLSFAETGVADRGAETSSEGEAGPALNMRGPTQLKSSDSGKASSSSCPGNSSGSSIAATAPLARTKPAIAIGRALVQAGPTCVAATDSAPPGPDAGSARQGGGRAGRRRDSGSGEAAGCADSVPSGHSSSPPGPTTGTEQSLWSSLSHLASLADLALADGKLPPAALHLAAETTAAALELPQSVWIRDTPTAWVFPKIRCGLVTLMSYAVRLFWVGKHHDCTDLAVLEPDWIIIWEALVRATYAVLRLRYLPATSAGHAVWVDVVRLLVRTDLLQCLSRAFVRMTSVGVEVEVATAAEDAGPMAAAAWTTGAGGPAQAPAPDGCGEGGRSGAALCCDAMQLSCSLLRSLVMVVMDTHKSAPLERPDVREAVRLLRNAILRSGVLEHCVRWAALPLRFAAAPAPGGGGGGAGAMGADGEAFCPDSFEVAAAGFPLEAVLYAVRHGFGPVAALAEILLSGPCMKHFLLLHAVSQLCAVDGGPDYGLPPGARLPPMPWLSEMSGGGAGDRFIATKAHRGEVQGGCHLPAELMTMSFHWWALKSRARPCSDRALWAVCERTAIAAAASTVYAEDGAAAAAAGAATTGPPAVDAAGGFGPLRARFWPPDEAVALGLAAVDCAFTLTRGGLAGDSRGLWAPVVAVASAAVRIGPDYNVQLYMTEPRSPLRLLMALPLTSLGAVLTDAGAFPPQPGPDLAAALAAGYVPALELAIRYEARLAGTSEERLLPVLQDVFGLLQNPPVLASFMAYGEPGTVASLLVTMAKASSRLLYLSADAYELRSLVNLAVLTAAASWDRSGSGPEDRFWWRLRSDANAPEPGAAAAGPGGGGGVNGVSSHGHDAHRRAAQLAPLHRLSLLAVFGLGRWLPLMAPVVTESGQPSGPEAPTVMCIEWWLPALVHAYLYSCRDPAAVSESDAAPSAPTSGSAAGDSGGHGEDDSDNNSGGSGTGGGSRGGDARTRREEAASWERLLLETLDLPRLAANATQKLYSCLECAPELMQTPIASTFVTMLLHLLIAFPRQGRLLLQTPLVTDGRPEVPLLVWVQSKYGRRADGLSDTMRHFLELAPAVAARGDPTAEDVARLRSAPECASAVRLGALLPPPCLVAAALPEMRLCANPMCANLEGEREASLRLTMPCEDGDGALSYCCQGCKDAHRRTRRAAQCGAGPGGRGLGRGEGSGDVCA